MQHAKSSSVRYTDRLGGSGQHSLVADGSSEAVS
jgi:hypothetical protein